MLVAAMFAAMVVPAVAGAREDNIFSRKEPSNPNNILYGGRGVSERSILAGIVSVFIPGLGQLINENNTGKVVVHFLLGVPLFLWSWLGPAAWAFTLWHVWSGWDALIDRPGGYINQLIKAPVPKGTLDASAGFVSPIC